MALRTQLCLTNHGRIVALQVLDLPSRVDRLTVARVPRDGPTYSTDFLGAVDSVLFYDESSEGGRS